MQTSTELIEVRCRMLRAELMAATPNSKTLQIVLQGSVLLRTCCCRSPFSFSLSLSAHARLLPSCCTEVNVGPMAICTTFLGEPHLYQPEDVERLRVAMRSFVELCSKALVLNKSLIDAVQLPFQEQLEGGYRSLHQQVSAHVDLTGIK